MSKQRKGYCLTINNPTDGYEDLFDNPKFEYAIFGRETAPTTGTRHLQAYVYYQRKVVASKVMAMFPGAHITQANGTPKANRAYCSKGGDFKEFGTLPKTAAQAGGDATSEKWAKAKAQAKSGDLDAIDPQIYICYYNTLRRIKGDNSSKVQSLEVLTNEWHYGPTGTGKSRTVREKYPDAFIKDANKWWDGYNNEDVVIIEDVDIYDRALGRFFKLWGDHYSFPAESKCQGKIDIRPKKIIVTSNYHPSEIWEDNKTYDPILRRFSLFKYQVEIPIY